MSKKIESRSERKQQDPKEKTRTTAPEKQQKSFVEYAHSYIHRAPDWYSFFRQLFDLKTTWDKEEVATYPRRVQCYVEIAEELARQSPVKLLLSDYTTDADAGRVSSDELPLIQRDFKEKAEANHKFLQWLKELRNEVKFALEAVRASIDVLQYEIPPDDTIRNLLFLLDFLLRLQQAQTQATTLDDLQQEWLAVNSKIKRSRFYELSETGKRPQALLALHSEQAVLNREYDGISAADILGMRRSEQSQSDVQSRRRAQTLQFLEILRKISYTDVFWPRIARAMYIGKQDLEGSPNQFEARAMLGAHQVMVDIAARLLLPSLISLVPELQMENSGEVLSQYPVLPDKEFDGAFAEALANTPPEFAQEFLEAILISFTQTDALQQLVKTAARKVNSPADQPTNPFIELAAVLREQVFPGTGATPPELFWRKLISRNRTAFEVDLGSRLLPRSLDAAERPYLESSRFFAHNMTKLLSVIPALTESTTEQKLAHTFIEHIGHLLGEHTAELLGDQASQMHEVSRTILQEVLESKSAELAYFDDVGQQREIVFAENDWMRQLGLHSLIFTQERDGSASFALTALDKVTSQLYGIVRVADGELEVRFNELQSQQFPGVHALLELCVAAFYTDLITRRRIAPEITVKQPIRRGLTGTAPVQPTEQSTAEQGDEMDTGPGQSEAGGSFVPRLKQLIRIARITAQDESDVLESTLLADAVERHARGGERAPHAVSPHPRWLSRTQQYQQLVEQYLRAEQDESEDEKKAAASELTEVRARMWKLGKDPAEIPAYIREQLGTVTDPITEEVFFLKTWVARYFVPAVTPEDSQDITRLYDRFKTPSNCSFLNLLRDVFLRELFPAAEK